MKPEPTKVALVTGANRGIGLGLTRELKRRAYTVIGTSRSLEHADELNQIARVLQLDVTRDASVDALSDSVGDVTIDVLVNNAGWLADNYPKSLADQTIEDAARSFDVNTLGPLRVLRALSSRLAADAKIINISSRLASLEGSYTIDGPGYCMSKTALNMLTRQIAFDPAMSGKTLVSVSPGWVRTRMGGPDARLSVEESTKGIADVIDRIGPQDSGHFFNYDGSRLPW